MSAVTIDPSVSLRLRPLVRTTPLANPAAQPVIVHPAGEPAWGRLAAGLARALAGRGIEATCTTDEALIPARSIPLPADYRRRPLLVLGALGTNRVLQPHYANYLCATDAAYPGDAGWELRTLVDPYHTGANLILAGGSRIEGVARAVARLEAEISIAPAEVVLPWLLHVELDPAVAGRFAAWPHTPLDAASVKIPTSHGFYFFADLIRTVSTYTHMWWLTADRRYAEVAITNLRVLNTHVTDSYGDWHYLAERFLRALPLLISGGWLTGAELTRTYDLLLGTALGTQNDWWRLRDCGPPLGHRHQSKGTYEFLLLARCLRDTAEVSPALQALCDRWIDECRAFLDGLVRAGIDDQDDESTLNNIAQLFRYALGEERHEFFTAGHARHAAARALALHDNMGNGAGQGGYGETLSMYYQQEAAPQIGGSALYYGDGELKWIFQHLPRLARAQRFMPFQFTPTFVQQFEAGDELAPQPPHSFCGLTLLPTTAHQYALCTHPPLHVEPRGHLANAPETWQLPEGVGLTRLAREQTFDKMVFRGGFAPTDPYLLLQGYQGGFRWQGHMHAANCIVRFAQAGHVWLVQNTVRHSPYDKNGLHVSAGTGRSALPPLAEQIATTEFAAAALTVTRLPDCAQADWTRHIFWSRCGAGWFVVIDRVRFSTAGLHSLTCTWRTPAWAALQDRRWQSIQGDHRFTLVTSDRVPATSEEETNQGATRPFVLRQRQNGRHEADDEIAFQNLFYVRDQNDREELDLQRLDAHGAIVLRRGQPIAWCGVALTADTVGVPGIAIAAASAWLADSVLILAGATALRWPGLAFQSATPVGLQLNLGASTLTLQTAASSRATVIIGEETHTLTEGQTLQLPADCCTPLVLSSQHWLSSQHPATTPPPAPSAPAPNPRWRTVWSRSAGPNVPERLRCISIAAAPPPVDGMTQQLINTIPPQSREIAEQWPIAPHYDITLRFPEVQAVESVSLLGDCVNEPTLHTFSPLPAGITLEAETADGARFPCSLNAAPDRMFKRVYVDLAVSLQQQCASVNRTVHALHLHCPAPAGGRPFVLHEIELYGSRHLPPAVKQWLAADLDGDGNKEIILCDVTGSLRALDQQGQTRWERALGLEATHLSIQPVGDRGSLAVCVGLIDGTLHVFDATGHRIRHCQLAEGLRAFTDHLMGVFYVVNSLAVWHRDTTGRGWLVAGGYGLMLFLDGDGRILGHSWADGAWTSSLVVLPEGHPAAGDLYARSGWNHGIGHYAAHPGSGPSGVVHSWGGFQQPMFRELRQVIPFVNGPALAFSHVPLPGQPAGAIFAAAELGCGLLSLATHEWLWQHEVAGRLHAARLGTITGRPAVLMGGADGFVTAFDLADGHVLHTHLTDAPIVGLDQNEAGDLTIATRTGLQIFSPDWHLRATLTRPLRRTLALDAHHFLLNHDDHTLELLELQSE